MKNGGNTNGMNWIRQEKRLAIYLRDGITCMYCRSSVEDGAQLTLDHVVPRPKGSNSQRNLVTCCRKCNTSKGSRPAPEFAYAVAEYINGGATTEGILKGIRSNTRKNLNPFLIEAKTMISRRGSAAKVIAARKEI